MNKGPEKINIQLFAEPGDGGTPNSEGGTPPAGSEGIPNPSGKSYTQDQLNSMMANEKRTARQALLKELGFEYKDDKDYKSVIKGIKETLDAGKTQAQRDAEAKKEAETQRDEANQKVALLETKISVLSEGANPEYLEDLITLVSGRVSQGKELKEAIKEVKERHPSLFKSPQEGAGNGGTGSPLNPPKKPNEGSDSLGKRLAKNNRPVSKSSYFKN